jgi:hypothetical protein
VEWSGVERAGRLAGAKGEGVAGML